MTKENKMRLYIAVHDDVPDFIVPTLVAHSMLGAHIAFENDLEYNEDQTNMYFKWLSESFRKCVIRVNEKEFNKISNIPGTYLGHENTTMDGQKSCAIVIPFYNDNVPNVLKFAKLWKPKI